LEEQMRKTVFALGLGVAIAGVSTVASAQNAQRPDSAHRHGRLEQGQQGPRRGGFGPGALLKGITLTDAQKTQLKALRTKAGPDSAHRAAQRATMGKIREARQRGDTVTAKALMQESRANMQKERDHHIGQIRAILTADQQKQFDANVAEMKQRMAQRGDKPFGGRRNGGVKRSGPSA
jgi:Spy/CpxP family protein refolding chaperone